MRILMAFHAPPYPPDIGPSRRHYHVLTETLKRHDVTMLSLGTADDREAFAGRFGDRQIPHVFIPNVRGAALNAARCGWFMATGRSDFHRLRRRAFQRALDDLVSADRFDLAYFSTTMLGCYRLPPHLPLVGDTHNIEHDNLRRAARHSSEAWRRAFYRTQASLTRREEIAYASRFSIVCTTSDRDRRLLSALVSVPTAVVPNGIDLEKYRRPADAVPVPGSILFTGLMSYYPNQHGVRRFVERVLPQVIARVPHARLRIVGANPPADVQALRSSSVEVTGRVDDVRPSYATAEACVIPLWIGGGTRVKALEAMAMGVPIVSTRLGCEGLNVGDGRSVLLADSDDALADGLVRVLTDQSLRGRLVAGASTVVPDYDWRRVGLALDEVFRAAARSVGALNPRAVHAGREAHAS
jgi:polysaccharide biosynthesis protein PslH